MSPLIARKWPYRSFGRKKFLFISLNRYRSCPVANLSGHFRGAHYFAVVKEPSLSQQTLHRREVTVEQMKEVQGISSEQQQSSAEETSKNSHVGQESEYTAIKEGLASILVPPNKTESVPANEKKEANTSHRNVFYNPVQQFNRDLSVLAIKTFAQSYINSQTASSKKLKGASRSAARKSKKRKREEAEAVPNQDPANDKSEAQEPEVGAEDGQPTNNADQKAENYDVQSQTNGETKLPSVQQFKILDALSATGLRALRYAHEIPYATMVTANDLSSDAVKSIDRNIKHNGLSEKIMVNKGNAISHMYDLVARPRVTKYEAIDLDPFGTAGPFLDAAVQALSEDGLLCVTCTDAGVFASTGYSEKTFALYGGLPLKGPHCHEAGLRLILHAIGMTAARYSNAIEPLLSLSIDFYARVFVKIRKSAADVKFLSSKSMMVYNCGEGCSSWTTQPIGKHKLNSNGRDYKFGSSQGVSSSNCEHCGYKVHVAGPMYAGPLHSAPFVQALLENVKSADENIYATKKRMEGMLTIVLEEALFAYPPESAREDKNEASPVVSEVIPRVDPSAIDHHPFFFNPHYLSKILHCQTPPEAPFRGALRGLGYRVIRSHTKPASMKTNAPWKVIWRVMREWIKQKAPVKEGGMKQNAAGWKILNTKDEEVLQSEENGDDVTPPQRREVVFDEKLGQEVDEKKLLWYQMNPRPNWGPMSKSGKAGP